MSTPGYQPPQPPVGTHGTGATPTPDAVAGLTAQVRRAQTLAGVATAVSVVALALGAFGLFGRGAPVVASPGAPVTAPAASVQPVPTNVTPDAKPRPADAGPVAPGTIVLGAVDQGKPVLDIYEDFQCPACASAEAHFGPEVKELLAAGSIEVRYHMMSFLDRGAPNGASWRAAAGGFCAHDQGKFQAFHDAVYAAHAAGQGHGWSDEQLAGFAGTAGLDVAGWQQCMASGKHADNVKQANDGSLAAGVDATPTYKVNGSKLDLQSVASAGGLKFVIETVR